MNIRSRLLSCAAALLLIPNNFTAAASGATITGTPWQGSPGIFETVEQIMARDPGEAGDGEGLGYTEGDDVQDRGHRTHNPHNPEAAPRHNARAPNVSQWPPPNAGSSTPDQPYAPQTIGVGFLGVQLAEAPFIPPDSMGAVGPSQVVVLVNGRIKVFTKTGLQNGLNTTTDNFFASVRSSNTSDPRICYDRLTQRWFVTMIDIAKTNRVLIAVSSGPTITASGGWTFFQFRHDLVGATPNSDTGQFADYDTLGVDRYALYIGVNIFTSTNTVVGTTGFVVNKSNLLSGTLTVTPFRQIGAIHGTGSGPWTPQGVSNDDPNSSEGYFIGEDRAAFGQLDLMRITDPGGTPSISDPLTITVPATTRPIQQAHKGDVLSKKLDGLDDRLFSAAIFKNKLTGSSSLWTAHNIQVNTSGVASSSGGRNGSRWYEIGDLTGAPTLLQAGTLFDSTSTNPRGFWIPSVAASGQGHMALGCSYAGSNDFAGVATAGRLRTDPLGSIQSPTLAVISATSYNLSGDATPHRWGDFSHTVVDPNDDMTMWTFQEYCNGANSWGVRAIQLKAPPPATPTNASPANVLQGQSNVTVVVTGISSAGSEFFDPGADPGGPGYSNHIAAAVSGGGVTVNSVAFSNTTNITLNISVSGTAAAGGRLITVTNPDGQTATSPSPLLTILAPPSITMPPTDVIAGQASNPTFIVTAAGTAPLSYQWRLSSVEIPGATDSSYTITNVQCSDAASYDVVVTNSLGSVTSSPAFLTIVGTPFISQNPSSQTVTGGQSATFIAAATNECGGGITYQWQFQGTNIPGATDTSFTRSNAQGSDAGNYVAIATSLGGSVTSGVATLTVLLPPTITGQPQTQSRAEGTNATFSVVVSGTPPFDYRWRLNGAAIPEATSSSYTRTNLQCPDGGGYDVIVTNSLGSVTSSIAMLTIVSPVTITEQPTNRTVAAGQPVSFSVLATNDCGGFSYQWQFSGTNVSGATNSSYTLNSAQGSNAGAYCVLVTNLAGSVTSAIATLTVLLPPAVDFSAAPISGPAPLTVYFTNLTTGATNYTWTFGEGNLSSLTNPTNTYANPGAYSVQLSATGEGGTNSLTRTNFIVVSLPPFVLTVEPLDPSNFIFSFPTFTGRTYIVQFKDSLDDSNWQSFQSAPGDGATRYVTNVLSDAPQRFFRVLVP